MSQKTLHHSLQAQLDQFFKGQDPLPNVDKNLLKAISDTYWKSELDYKMLQRCLEISSQELMQANSDLREIFNVMPDLMFRVDKRGIVIDFKGGVDNRLGIPRWTSVGSQLEKLLPDEIYKAIKQTELKLQQGQERLGVEVAVRNEKEELYYEVRLLPLPEDQLLLILQDITSRKKAEENIALTNKRLELQNQTLFDIAINPAVYAGEIENAFREIAETAAKTLNVERVAIWLYDEKHTYIKCLSLYERSASQHNSDQQVFVKDHPAYFKALATGRIIAAHSAQTDPVTSEFLNDYLVPNGITSILAAPIRSGGHYIGVICHEHTGNPRKWTPDEQQFAVSMADMVSLVYETNAKQKAQQALLESEERFRILSESSNSAIFAFRKKILYANPAMEYLSDYTEQELLQKSVKDIFGAGFFNEVKERLAVGVHHSGGYVRRECMLTTKQGEQRWLFITVGLVQLHGAPTFLASAFDITERKVMEEQLRHQAFHDKLTGLPNRALFMDRLEQCLALTKRYPEYKSAVLFLDIDRFKVVNDSLGHLVGDKLLNKIGRRLRKQMRECDTVARLGGDEFTLLIGDTQTAEQAAQIADRIQKKLSNVFVIEGNDIFITASIGIAVADSKYMQADHILRDADIAMYRAKASGKACHEIFDSQMHKRAQQLQQLETDLHRAIRNKEFELYYQPLVSLKDGCTTGFEALLRWNQNEEEICPPTQFIALAEETGLIIPLGDWVFKNALRQLFIWQTDNPDINLSLNVNLSGKQFESNDLVDNIRLNILENNVNAKNFKVELTESSIIENSEVALEKLTKLKELGVEVSIDDFGTGYSSLSYLHKFPIDSLKIDRSFITEIDAGGQNAEIASAIISMAHSLGLQVVAEGVETKEQLEVLIKLQCDFAQGFLFSKPVSADEATKMINRKWALLPQKPASITSIKKQ
ncbi:MAG: EAL domain-containing protein [Gammaproteobacteria bacterium]|nr:EAL domain-containing protein [Gammaproteobacteria bacterium]